MRLANRGKMWIEIGLSESILKNLVKQPMPTLQVFRDLQKLSNEFAMIHLEDSMKLMKSEKKETTYGK